MIHDDLHAYLEFPIRALESGTLNADPFNLRRLESSLGGMSFLDAVFISKSKIIFLNLLDLGIAKLLFVGLCFLIAFRLQLGLWQQALFISLSVLMPAAWVNLTAGVTGEVLFLYLISEAWTVVNELKTFSWQRGLEMGIVIGTLISLKSTFLVGAVLVLLVFCVLLFVHSKAHFSILLKSLTVLCGSCFLVLISWMTALKQSSGTFLYPILGTGFHVSTEGPGVGFLSGMPSRNIALELLQIIFYPEHLIIAVLTAYLFFAFPPKDRIKRFLLLGLSSAVGLSSILVGLSTGFASVHRYSYPLFFPYVLFLFGLGFSLPKSRFRLIGLSFLGILLLASDGRSILFNSGLFITSLREGNLDSNFIRLRGNPFFAPKSQDLSLAQAQMAALQASIPEGARFFTHLSDPFLLNFKRNPVFVGDFPGSISPPPGMLAGAGAENMAEYFRNQSICYIAYSYKSRANLSKDLIAQLNRKKSVWPFQQQKIAEQSQDLLVELGKNYPKLYDDGENFVIDLHLMVPVSGRTASPPPCK